MRSLGLVAADPRDNLTLLSQEVRWELAEWSKGIAYFLSFLVYFSDALTQKMFLDADVSQYIFAFGSVALFLHIFAIHAVARRGSQTRALSFSYVVDALFIAFLILLLKTDHSIFLLLAAMNIILAAFVRGMQFSLLLAMFSSAAVNFAFVGALPLGPALLKTILIYNGSFFILAVLAGILSDELARVAAVADERAEDIKNLQNLNEFVFDSIPSGVLVLDAGGQIVRSNRGAMRILEDLGLSQRHVREVFPGLWEEVRSYKDAQSVEWKHMDTHGATMLLEVQAAPLKVKKSAAGIILLFRNITEIRALENKLRQNEKLAAIGQLAAGIAHEIRNPLASISGSVQLLAGTLKVESLEDKKLLSIVIKEIDRLNNLISEFMDYVRPDVVIDDVIKLQDILSEILDVTAHNERLTKGVQVIRNFQNVPIIKGSAAKLKQAFLNIVINAYQAMEKSERKRLDVSLHATPEELIVEIRDTGIGISPENLHRIFEPFHTTKPKGTGLGLALTQKVLESHRAQVEVESIVGQGTLFRIKFPLNSN